MNFLTHKLVPLMLLTSSLATSAYCMESNSEVILILDDAQAKEPLKCKYRRNLSDDTTRIINTFAEALRSKISQKSELPNILLWGTPDGINKTTGAENLAKKCGFICLRVSIADLCKDDQNEGAKKLAELFKSAETSTKKVMLIVEDANAFKESSSITNQFLVLTGTPSSNYMLAFTIDNYTDLPKELLSRVNTKVYIDTALAVDDDGIDPTKIYITTSPESEANLDGTVEPKGECSLQ